MHAVVSMGDEASESSDDSIGRQVRHFKQHRLKQNKVLRPAPCDSDSSEEDAQEQVLESRSCHLQAETPQREAAAAERGHPISKSTAHMLLCSSWELIGPDTFRIGFRVFVPRMTVRPFVHEISSRFPEATVDGWDAPDSDSSRVPSGWRLPRSSYHMVCSWAEEAAAAWPDLARSAQIGMPDWLLDAWPSAASRSTAPEESPKFLSQCNSLFEYQKEGIREGVRRGGRILIGDEMGLGKTVQAIGIAAQWQEEWPVLVVCPSSLRGVWRNQLKQWTDLADEEVQTIYSEKDKVSESAKWVVVSYVLLARRQDFRLRADGSGRSYQIVVLDECHYIKNEQSQRTKASLQAICKAQRAILLSGTALLNDASELQPMLASLRPNFPDFETFTNRYFETVEKKFGKYVFSDPVREQELHFYLHATVMLRRRKADVLKELPEKRRQIVELVASDRSAREQLRQAEKTLHRLAEDSAEFRRELEATAELVANAKLGPCCEYIDELLDGGIGKFLLFAHHKKVLNALEAKLRERLGSCFVRIDGSTSQKERPGLVSIFQDTPSCHVALLSITAMAEGHTMTSAEAVIFAEMIWTPGIMEQCEARAHRVGQKGCVFVQYLQLAGSLTDRKLLQRLNFKHKHIGAVLDGDAAPGPLLTDRFRSEDASSDVLQGMDSQGMRPKARCRPGVQKGTHPKSRSQPPLLVGKRTIPANKCAAHEDERTSPPFSAHYETSIGGASNIANGEDLAGDLVLVAATGEQISKRVLECLPDDAPRGHVVHQKVKVAKNGAVALNWPGVAFQTTVNAAGSKHAALVIARACWMEFEKGKAKDTVLEFRKACYARVKNATPSRAAASKRKTEGEEPKAAQPTKRFAKDSTQEGAATVASGTAADPDDEPLGCSAGPAQIRARGSASAEPDWTVANAAAAGPARMNSIAATTEPAWTHSNAAVAATETAWLGFNAAATAPAWTETNAAATRSSPTDASAARTGPSATSTATGTCTSFNSIKGWGFIDMAGTTIFVHNSDCEAGKQPKVGDVLIFTTEPKRNNPSQMQARNVTGCSAPRESPGGAPGSQDKPGQKQAVHVSGGAFPFDEWGKGKSGWGTCGPVWGGKSMAGGWEMGNGWGTDGCGIGGGWGMLGGMGMKGCGSATKGGGMSSGMGMLRGGMGKGGIMGGGKGPWSTMGGGMGKGGKDGGSYGNGKGW
eukprot:TRINITY_DN21448_c0_g1_i1.p1 TRINITY_DN21448_c0_g1~~TRINITY_DN21448_c0_g1_i1.p1  ORF type:complete len:1195 (+),score=215.21 TRINITY_DN21448_c0_g1_i1:91-3675(+)